MGAGTKSKIERLLELPCVNVDEEGGRIVLTLKSQMHMTMECLFDSDDPVGIFMTVTMEQRDQIMEAFYRKFQVLAEIRNGTNRYKIVGGDFEKIGEDG